MGALLTMRYAPLKLIALGLALCLLVVSGAMSTQIIGHAAHHSHHKAATHGTVLCAWMCAAGQVVSSASGDMHTDLLPITSAHETAAPQPAGISLPSSTTRGPPPSLA